MFLHFLDIQYIQGMVSGVLFETGFSVFDKYQFHLE